MAANNDLKNENIQKIRSCFYDLKEWTKNELSEKTRLSLAGTTNVLQELLEKGEILYIGDAKSTGGRKSKRYVINPDYKHIGIINLRKTSKYYLLLGKSYDLNQKIYSDCTYTSQFGNLEDLIEIAQHLVNSDSMISTLVISIPGVVINGTVEICDYPELIGENLIDTLELLTKKKVIIENDVNVACIGFYYEHPNVKHLAFIYQPSQDYVGVGMVVEGKLYNGFSHFAGELRYLPFYTNEEQERMLKENPEDLLLKQVATLCTVMNPQMIGYHSDCITKLNNSLICYGIPAKHTPILIKVEDLDQEINQGLYSIGLNEIKEKGE